MKQSNFIILNEHNNIRLDKVLNILLPKISRSQIQKAIKSGTVTINDQIINDSNHLVKYNDSLSFTLEDPPNLDIVATNIPLEIVYEDEYLILINKPAGLTVHPGAGNHQDTLVNALIYYTNNLSDIGGLERPGIVHRLDKDTSGLMVVAKNNYIHNYLANEIQNRQLIRKYKALIWGRLAPTEGVINLNIARSKTDRKKMSVAKLGGKEAVTFYKTEKFFQGGKISLVTCKLQTGRTHQIRVHLSHVGHSVVGDQTYGSNSRKISSLAPDIQLLVKNLSRQALHSYYLAFTHPVNQEFMEFEIPMAEDIEKLISGLE